MGQQVARTSSAPPARNADARLVIPSVRNGAPTAVEQPATVGEATVTSPPAAETKEPTAAPVSECKDGKCKPLTATKVEALKTGAFICSNCRKPKIADWHTDWKEDGTPETFLCKSCHAFMTPAQRKAAFDSYQARQFISAGSAGLLHQEVAK